MDPTLQIFSQLQINMPIEIMIFSIQIIPDNTRIMTQYILANVGINDSLGMGCQVVDPMEM